MRVHTAETEDLVEGEGGGIIAICVDRLSGSIERKGAAPDIGRGSETGEKTDSGLDFLSSIGGQHDDAVGGCVISLLAKDATIHVVSVGVAESRSGGVVRGQHVDEAGELIKSQNDIRKDDMEVVLPKVVVLLTHGRGAGDSKSKITKILVRASVGGERLKKDDKWAGDFEVFSFEVIV